VKKPVRRALLAVCLLLLPVRAGAQEVRLTGQLRPRVEDRDPEFRTPATGKSSMRVRLGLTGTLPEAIGVRVELQDVLLFGATPVPSTTELHQAFIDVGSLGLDGLSARFGRQEMVVGNQRLLSNNNWGQRGRRFDGLRAMFARPALRTDGLVVRLPSGTSTLDRGWLFGGHAALAQPGDTLDLYALHQREREAFESDQFTGGGYGRLTIGRVGIIGEGYLQTGTRRDLSVSSYFFGGGLTGVLGPATLSALYDHYSGDPDLTDDEARAFDRLYGSNHSYHGYVDFFTNIPADTGGRGLRDLMLRAVVALGGSADVQLDGHAFQASEQATLPSTRFGEELDLVLRLRARPALALEGGASYYWTGSALTAVQGLQENLAWGYLMVTTVF
jgi:hypothetical protein